MKQCTTHHYACACREAKFKELEEKIAEKEEMLMWAKKSIERLMQEKSVLLSYLFDIDPAVDLEKVFRVEREAER